MTIAVQDQDEADLLKEGLEDPILRAFVKVSAALKRLPDDEARERALKASAILLDVPYPRRDRHRE